MKELEPHSGDLDRPPDGAARKNQLVAQITASMKKRVEPEMSESVEHFVDKYFRLVSPDDMIYTEPATLEGGVASLWEYSESRLPGNLSLRLYNPTLDREGWGLEHTVIEIVNDDMPFLVDSVAGELQRLEITIHEMIHPVIDLHRDAKGRRVSPSDTSTPIVESYMHIEIDQETGQDRLDEIEKSLVRVLADVRTAVADWRTMTGRLAEVLAEVDDMASTIPHDELEETKAFLRWLDDKNFVFLGYRRYRFITREDRDFLEVEPETGLGILRELRPESRSRSGRPFTPEFSRFARRKEILVVAKANNRSTIHRPVHMDRISVKRFDSTGKVIGEHRFLGLFTSVAYSRSVTFIPMLRRKVTRLIDRAGLGATSHAGKALEQILESFPRDELFQINEDELFEMALGILQLQERSRIALFVRRDVFERFVSCLVYIPRDHYDSGLREKVNAILEIAFSGTVVAYYTQITDSPLARVHFIVQTTPGAIPNVDVKRVEALIAEAARSWADHLREEIVRSKHEEKGLTFFDKYRNAFPVAYRERFKPSVAVADIDRMERSLETRELVIDLYEQANDDRGGQMELRCKLVNTGSPLALSDVVPRLENMGLRVEMAAPYEVRPEGSPTVRIRDFSLISPDDLHFDARQTKDIFEEAFLHAWNGDTEDDGFHRLVIRAGLPWNEIVVLRAYCKYLRQTGITFSEAYMQETLANNAYITRELISLFKTLFDPSLQDAERQEASAIRSRIKKMFESVRNVDEDRILRRYLNLIDATVRTNYFQKGPSGGHKKWLSFKLDSKKVKELPLPRPMYEIFVYSPRFEGVHLRGGKVARGGLRWSDRREDFRDEILGLVKAQIVKNAVIVPVGSKGGFVLKQAPPSSNREEFLKEGIACYQDFLRGLLDLTDNLVEGRVVPPPDVVRRDDDDTYLVVAADKGTATFSDIANGISAEYGFWLGDAFASGGSIGYDHKKMGITARGAWEAVKRHFREMGVDTQSQDFTVVGVGDMSGDVFGNGMLLSEHTRMVGAFNHVHIFVDPDPDPAVSFRERQRLFGLPRSTWMDYDSSLLSKGGGVFDRTEKTINISKEAAKRFGITQKSLSPNDLVRAMLKAEVDLLWLGGIGTFVKGTDERHAEVRDRANDAVRIDASELRVKVIGEGANLGLTQLARIEFALRKASRSDDGGRLNTDAIDNSAGVDTSDHEVNIKILLDQAVRLGEITPEERLRLLSEMTDDVAALVLRDNYQQTQSISVTETQGTSVLDQQIRLIRHLERAGRLQRAIEFLPDDETFAERTSAGIGLTRPELAVLLAYSKIWIYEELLDSDLPDDPLLEEDLLLYFPQQLRVQFRDLIGQHRLRREIIATYVTNSMVNRVGPTFISRMIQKTGRTASDVARAFIISRESFCLRTTWGEIEALDNKVPAELQTAMLIDLQGLVERMTLWFLRNISDKLEISTQEAQFRRSIAALEERLMEILPPRAGTAYERRVTSRVEIGMPADLARRLAALDLLGSFPDIVRISSDLDRAVEEVGRAYFELGARFEFDRLRSIAPTLSAESPWQQSAIEGVVDDLFLYQKQIVARVLESAGEDSRINAVDFWLESRHDFVSRTDQLLSELFSASTIELSMLLVASRQLRDLAES